MKNLLTRLLLVLLCLGTVPAFAQGTARVVTSCGTLPQVYVAGSTRDMVQDINGNLCNAGASTAPSTTPVQGAVNVTPTDCSGAIASGGAAQNAFAANASLHGFTIANIDTSEVMWISFTTTAAASGTGSFPLAPATATSFAGLSSFTTPLGFGINTALSVIAVTTTHKFSCTRW